MVKNAGGQTCSKRAAAACYFDPVGVPLADVESPKELDRFDALFERWDYSSVYDEPIKDLARRAREQYEATDRAVVSAVIVLDDSHSMLYQDEGRARFESAKRMAGELMERFEVGSEAVLLTTSNPVGSLTYDLDTVRNQIEAATAGPRKASI